MVKIEKQMLEAFENWQNYHKDNTCVKVFSFGVVVWLHGNVIAIKQDRHKIFYSTAGWNTRTTCSRLNALGCNVRIKNGIICNQDGSEFESANLEEKLSDLLFHINQ